MPTIFQRLQDFANSRTGPRTKGVPAGTKSRTPNRPDTVDYILGQASGDLEGVAKPDRPMGGPQYDERGNLLTPDQVRVKTDPRAAEKAAREQISQELSDQERRRTKGRASTIITGGTGLFSSPSVARRSLMGF